uniref:Actin-related protein 8 n=2 Tax=Timema TaxID=61471 RepID=A0A7R9NUA6_9NEOP|nr:unnamed protein product [Timema tahoe]
MSEVPNICRIHATTLFPGGMRSVVWQFLPIKGHHVSSIDVLFWRVWSHFRFYLHKPTMSLMKAKLTFWIPGHANPSGSELADQAAKEAVPPEESLVVMFLDPKVLANSRKTYNRPALKRTQQIQAQTIIIIHPGSLNLRIGRATDLNPHTILHVIARKRLYGGPIHRDPFLPMQGIKVNDMILQEMEECRLQVSHTLQSCLQSDGHRRYATPPQQIAAFNRRAHPVKLSDSGGEWIKPEENIVVGDEVLTINPNLDYNIHFPFKRGDLNIHDGPGGSLTAVLANLETIWTRVIHYQLGIPPWDLKHYRAVLVIPDIYNRQYLKELTTLLLCKIGFGGCFLLQDHVAATFGAGLGYACVIDVGDQKTSVSCVEDGISHRNTRVRMEYGGGDITQAFHWLLQKCAFPYKSCSPDNKLDAMLLRKLKENFCHVNLNICGSQEKSFIVGDECIVAPLSLFQPELLGLSGPKVLQVQKLSTGDPEDPHDDSYLRETSVTTEELKRKMYGCILVIGGGMKFTGIGTWLQNRISLQIPYMYRAEQLDIITNTKEIDQEMTAWKGAAIMSCLESAPELWIYTPEWEKNGVKLLRERAPFMW